MSVLKDFPLSDLLTVEISSASFPVRKQDFKAPVADWATVKEATKYRLTIRGVYHEGPVVEVFHVDSGRVLARVRVTTDANAVRDDWVQELIADLLELVVRPGDYGLT